MDLQKLARALVSEMKGSPIDYSDDEDTYTEDNLTLAVQKAQKTIQAKPITPPRAKTDEEAKITSHFEAKISQQAEEIELLRIRNAKDNDTFLKTNTDLQDKLDLSEKENLRLKEEMAELKAMLEAATSILVYKDEIMVAQAERIEELEADCRLDEEPKLTDPELEEFMTRMTNALVEEDD